MNSSYITSAKEAEQLPKFESPELAFVGRSNCGKSSLLNSLLGRTNLARTSRTPGRTQMVNFFSVKSGERELILADLPGYGYSATGGDVRGPWEDLMAAYLRREAIQVFLFLMDARRAGKPATEDLELIGQLAMRRPVIVVLTKSDKVNQREASRLVQVLKTALQARHIVPQRIVLASTLKGQGIEDLREEIQSHLMPPPT